MSKASRGAYILGVRCWPTSSEIGPIFLGNDCGEEEKEEEEEEEEGDREE